MDGKRLMLAAGSDKIQNPAFIPGYDDTAPDAEISGGFEVLAVRWPARLCGDAAVVGELREKELRRRAGAH
jgi:hypothetical protein